ncbi:hypothetical protein K493DRAFT_340089 [Basidiobolus meristosporus CBS 931.73]|uniref:Uncharacterized protein n=1 Tax=Basidiobolus meristosporus CBS 931.73 TaxID=1314790 RepID=A0A1Y1XY86_9FUNG|nr:hypothetical protein K493DRAFT_340089 [Basidiobolus meristosporus CBS 931.73]|eukprot:ORX90324.1 hypothetical protein K493DRAFT_340089 [Basidiobolus meristosporus CBS 931.73]
MSSDSDYLAFLQKQNKTDKELAQKRQENVAQDESQASEVEDEVEVEHSKNPELVKQIRTDLLDATEDLLYISEADYPFTFFFIPSSKISEKRLSTTKLPSVEEFSQLIKLDAPVAETQTSFGAFFDALEDSSKFSNLKKVFDQYFQSSDLAIYRLGQIEISVWLTGLIEDVGLIGVSTLSVES